MEKSLAKNSVFNVIYNIANILFPLITTIYVSRVLQADGIGKVAYGQNIVSYFCALATLGLPTYGVREIAKVRDNLDERNQIFSELVIINTIATSVATLLYLGIIFSVQKFDDDRLLYMACGVQLILNYINIDWLFQGCEEYVYIAVRSIIVKTISFVLVIACIRRKEDYILYAFLSSFALTANYFFNIIKARKYIRIQFRNIKLIRHCKPLVILALSIFLSTAYSRIDVTMLGGYCNDTTVGIYTNAHRIVEVTTIVSISISAVFLPRLSYFYNNDRNAFNELIKKGINILCFLSFPLFVGLLILAPQLIQMLFGTEFISGAPTIRIFSPLVLVKSFGNLLCYQLVIATGSEKKRLPAYLAGAITNGVLNMIFIPRLAQNGAAIASVLSEVAVNGIQFFAMSKIICIAFPKKALIQAVTSSLIMGVIVFMLSLAGESFFLTCMCVISGMVVYIVVNMCMHNTIVELLVQRTSRFLRSVNE